jgi:tryptophan synthase beta chain
VTDGQAMDALKLLAHTEGILCAIETAHAMHGAVDVARELGPDGLVLVCLSGRGDKDMDTAARWFGLL